MKINESRIYENNLQEKRDVVINRTSFSSCMSFYEVQKLFIMMEKKI